MKYVVTITHSSPTEDEPSGGVGTVVYLEDRMIDALKRVDDAEFNGTVFINVSITPIREASDAAL